jgi:hypothetical protein
MEHNEICETNILDVKYHADSKKANSSPFDQAMLSLKALEREYT